MSSLSVNSMSINMSMNMSDAASIDHPTKAMYKAAVVADL